MFPQTYLIMRSLFFFLCVSTYIDTHIYICAGSASGAFLRSFQACQHALGIFVKDIASKIELGVLVSKEASSVPRLCAHVDEAGGCAKKALAGGSRESFRNSEGPSTQYLRPLLPKTMALMVFGIRILEHWVLGPSEVCIAGRVQSAQERIVPSHVTVVQSRTASLRDQASAYLETPTDLF